MYCKIYQAFQLIIITAHAIKSPIVIYNPQISRSKLTRLEMEKNHQNNLQVENGAQKC